MKTAPAFLLAACGLIFSACHRTPGEPPEAKADGIPLVSPSDYQGLLAREGKVVRLHGIPAENMRKAGWPLLLESPGSEDGVELDISGWPADFLGKTIEVTGKVEVTRTTITQEMIDDARKRATANDYTVPQTRTRLFLTQVEADKFLFRPRRLKTPEGDPFQ